MINEVKYVEMNSAFGAIQESSANIGEMISALSRWTSELRTVWSGKLFNDFLKNWNINVEPLRGYAIILETKVPECLNQIIKNYASYDQNDGVVVDEFKATEKARGIEKVNLTDETLESIPNVQEMERIFGDMVGGFSTLLTYIVDLENKVNALPWDSDSHENFTTNFLRISTHAKGYITNLQTLMCGKLQSVIENAKAVNAANSETVV